MEQETNTIWIEIKDEVGVLRDITSIIAKYRGNIAYIEQLSREWRVFVYIDIEDIKNIDAAIQEIEGLDTVISVKKVESFNRIYGKRVIIIGGGAQVAEVAKGAISEADRHNIRGEKISVDTIPLVGEENIASAVRAVARLPRAKILVLAGSIMGGEITTAIKEIQKEGISVISLNMAGSVPDAADLVVTDPIQSGVMAVMTIADTAKFDIKLQKNKKY